MKCPVCGVRTEQLVFNRQDRFCPFCAEFFNKDKTMNIPIVPKAGFTFGCDPELFVLDDKGRFVCADMIPGTKDCPFPVTCGAVQRDGMAAEFNIEPASDFATFDNNISTVLDEMKKFLPKGYAFIAKSSATFEKDLFDRAPDDSKELGCMPDFNAWTGELNPPPKDPENPYLRSAAGHLHIGWTDGAQMDDMQHIMNCNDLVKQFDWYLGAWSAKHDSDPLRRRLYGRAGACRYKSYGVEYRVLSNFWVMDSALRLEVWNRMQAAINDMSKSFMPDRASGYCDRLITSINNSVDDRRLAENFPYPLREIQAKPAKRTAVPAYQVTGSAPF